MRYAKLVQGAIEYAPNPIFAKGHWVGNPGDDVLTALGYLPVIYTEPPDVDPGFVAVEGWVEDGGSIVQTWTVEEEPDEVDSDRAMEILFGEDEE